MAGSLNITSAIADAELLDLPWNLALEEWPDDTIAALPKGISRHLVRFAHLSGYVIAIKETSAEFRASRVRKCCARFSASMYRASNRSRSSRTETDIDGNDLDSVLVTRHLKFSLPYRALYSQSLRPDTATRLVDALAVLLVTPSYRRLLLGRRVAFEHAVPARRRRIRRLPRRCRDRAALRRAIERAARKRPRDRARQHRWRAPRSSVGWPARRGSRSDRGQQRHRPRPTEACGRKLTGSEGVRPVRALAHQSAGRATQQPGFRHRGTRDQGRMRAETQVRNPAQGRRCRPSLQAAAATHRPGRWRESGQATAQRSRFLPGHLR